jgi:DNA-binding XRE family transcriptional regulator
MPSAPACGHYSAAAPWPTTSSSAPPNSPPTPRSTATHACLTAPSPSAPRSAQATTPGSRSKTTAALDSHRQGPDPAPRARHRPRPRQRMRHRRRPGRPHRLGPVRLDNLMAIKPTSHAERWTAVVDGQVLRAVRRERALSQVELAKLAGVSACTVAKRERRRTTCCRTRTLAQLAAALGQDPPRDCGQRGPALGLRPRDSSCEDFLYCHQGRVASTLIVHRLSSISVGPGSACGRRSLRI